MKRVLSILAVAMLAVSFAGCGGKDKCNEFAETDCGASKKSETDNYACKFSDKKCVADDSAAEVTACKTAAKVEVNCDTATKALKLKYKNFICTWDATKGCEHKAAE